MVNDLMRRERSGVARSVSRRAMACFVETKCIVLKRTGMVKAFHDEFTRQRPTVSFTLQKVYQKGLE